jgi:CheY-like chemotaxis protein
MDTKYFVRPPEKTHDISAAAESTRSRSVLLLEDDPEFRDLLTTELQANGFTVTCVANGVEGLKKIMAADFDVILCDMMMPSLPGDMFYIAIERTKPHLCKRFVFMTGHKGEKKIDEFIRKVRGIILWKPFQFHDLLQTIQVVLQKHAEK